MIEVRAVHCETERRRVARLVRRTVGLSCLLFALTLVPLPRSAEPVVASQAVLLEKGVAATGFDEVIDLELEAEMVGFTWSGPGEATIEVRGLNGTTWGEWLHLEGSPLEAPDTDTGEGSSKVSAGPAWLGNDIERAQVRVVEGSAPQLTAHAINSEAPSTNASTVAVAGADTPLPSVISRSGWRADESWRSLHCSGEPSYARSLKFAVVHHTVNSNSYGPGDSAALIRGIYHFHTHTNGWCDIAYNFLIDRYGKVFEGRYGGINQAVVGGHASGFNTGSTGVSLLGDFSQSAVPGDAYAALRRLLGWKLAYHGVDPRGTTTHTVGANTSGRWPEGTVVTIPNVMGHRDGNQTGCPGEHLYALLPQLREHLAADIAATGKGAWTCAWDQSTSSGPAAVSPVAGRLDIFARGEDGQLWQKVDTSGKGGGSWSPLGGYLTSDPDASSWGAGRLDVFGRGSDRALWHRAWTGSSWTAWESLGGYLSAAPTAVSWGPNRIDVFGCGIDGALWQRSWNGTGWSQWTSLGGDLLSAPDASSSGPGRIEVFARGIDHRIWYRRFADGVWSGWATNDGGFTAGPGSTRRGVGQVAVAGRGLDQQIYINSQSGSAWTGWQSLGGLSASDVDAASVGPGLIDVVIRGVDGRYWRRSFSGTAWSAWFVTG